MTINQRNNPADGCLNQNKPSANRLLQKVESKQGIERLITVTEALRDPQHGCPWDRKQSYKSILPYTIEEVYEVAEAIETEDFASLKDELGDLLFQVMFYAQIAREEQRFDFNAIVENICNKLIRRHPHIFADVNEEDELRLNQAWEEQKQQERNQKAALSGSVLDDVPKALPELKRAQKLQKRAAKVGFDWEELSQVWDKVDEECAELKQAAEHSDKAHIEEEIGDLLFAAVNLSRHYRVDADMALRKASHKFEQRFRQVEKLTEKPLNESSIEEMEALWLQVKTTE